MFIAIDVPLCFRSVRSETAQVNHLKRLSRSFRAPGSRGFPDYKHLTPAERRLGVHFEIQSTCFDLAAQRVITY